MTKGTVISFSMGAVVGAAIWGLSPLITKAVEPWDAESPYYFVSLFIAGGLLGLLYPRHIWVVFLGIVAGQMAYMFVVLPAGPLLPLGLLFLVGYGLLSLLGLTLGSRIRELPGSLNSGG